MAVSHEAARQARIAAQHLGERLPAGRAADAAAAGLRDSPAGAARDALAARVESVPTDLAAADLVGVWGPRAAPYLVAAADLAVFTRGALPADEPSARKMAPSAAKAVAPHGRGLLDTVEQVGAAMAAVVADGPVDRDDLHQQLRERLPAELLWWCKGCQSAHVHPMLWRMGCQLGAVRRELEAPGRAVTFAAVDLPLDPAGDAVARAELTRRALHHHGPLTTTELAAWLSASRADASARLAAIAGEVEEVHRAGRAAWALKADLPLLADPPQASGVRLLPTGDPLLDGRDRDSILLDPGDQKVVWAAIGGPGAVLRDGRVVATWRAKATRGQLAVTLTPFSGQGLPPAQLVAVEAEALAAARGLAGARVR